MSAIDAVLYDRLGRPQRAHAFASDLNIQIRSKCTLRLGGVYGGVQFRRFRTWPLAAPASTPPLRTLRVSDELSGDARLVLDELPGDARLVSDELSGDARLSGNGRWAGMEVGLGLTVRRGNDMAVSLDVCWLESFA